MKKVILTGLFIALASPALSAEWVDMSKDKEGKLFVDLQSIRVEKNVVAYWVKSLSGANSESKMYFISDCDDKLNALATVVTTKDGKTTKTDIKDVDLAPVVPDTMAEVGHNYVCSIVMADKKKWDILMSNNDKAMFNKDYYNAEIFLKQAIQTAQIMKNKGFDDEFLLISEASLAKLYVQMNRKEDALSVFQALYSHIPSKQKYGDLRYQVNKNIDDLNRVIKEEQRHVLPPYN